MSYDKKNTPNRDKKATPGRERPASAPAARRKKSESDDPRSASSLREKKAGPPRRKSPEADSERSAAPQRRPASFSPRTKKTEDAGEKSRSPFREKRAASPTDRSKRSEGDAGRKTAPVRGKNDATAGDKNLVFPREARRYINVFLGLGSNVGNRRAQLQAAINLISDQVGKIAKKSHLYETQPWGNPDQDAFLNQVIMINTMLDPRDLLKEIGMIEQELGRVRNEKEKWGPRTIDIDILFYGKRVVRDKGLEVPHPELHQRAFVLVPLMEIAPDLEHPILKQPIDELYMACEDQSDVIMLDA